MTLEFFLRDKPLYYNEIDYSRMPRIYTKIKSHLKKMIIIHVIGTNGKGTTGRFLASALHNLGYKTGHYTSPHILEFNERVWINGRNASYKLLEKAHIKLQNLLSQEDSDSLSYFEYTTFLAMLAFEFCEYVVLEAGMGGEHDATAVFPKNLTLVTPIDYDHQSFLGNDIQSISREKLNAIQNKAITAKQKYNEVYTIIEEVQTQKKVSIVDLGTLIQAKDKACIKKVSQELSLAPYLEDNLSLSISALNFLELEYSAESFNDSRLFGRLTQFSKNIILDVGHNPLAAMSILKALETNKYTLVYNTYKDKEYVKILKILKPIIQSVEIIHINDERIAANEELQNTLISLEVEYSYFKQIDASKSYLVFGSFSVVEAFLKVVSE